MNKNYFVGMQKGFLALTAAALLFSCSQNEMETPSMEVNALEQFKVVQTVFNGNETARELSKACGDIKIADLIAGQKINVGTVTTFNDKDSVYIKIDMNHGWFIRKSHLYTGQKSATAEIRNPAPGKFPEAIDVSSLNNWGIDTYTYAISAETLKNWGEFDVAVHADVVQVVMNGDQVVVNNGLASVLQSQGAWAKDQSTEVNLRFTAKGNWATYFRYTYQECNVAVICSGSWIRPVTGSGNNEPFNETFDFDEFDLMEGPNVVGKVSYLRAKRAGQGNQPSDITVTFEITKDGYTFDGFSALHSSTSAFVGLTKDNFTTINTTPTGGTIVFPDVANNTYYLGLYAKITGLCKIN